VREVPVEISRPFAQLFDRKSASKNVVSRVLGLYPTLQITTIHTHYAFLLCALSSIQKCSRRESVRVCTLACYYKTIIIMLSFLRRSFQLSFCTYYMYHTTFYTLNVSVCGVA